jgi:hypothetical protein
MGNFFRPGKTMKQTHGATYDPEAIALLLSALDEAWETLPPARRAMTSKTTLAQRILRLAANGERDPIRLRIAALIEIVDTAA